MNNTAAELIRLWELYKGDSEAVLEGETNLDYLYALSKARENLLEWFPFQAGKKLLQVGADCGSLTGMFLEKGLEVTVLDTCEDQLAFVEKRYSQAAEGQIFYRKGSLTEDSDQIKSEQGKFDYVTIIGSLESGEEELRRQIKNGKKLLAAGGSLFVAADNPTGLKHWAGVPAEGNAIGRKRLKKVLEKGSKTSRGQVTMYYPFPDYKLPTEIYSDTWLPEKGDLSGAVISYDYPEFLKTEIGPSYDMVCKEGSFREFSNSFLAVWTKGSRGE